MSKADLINELYKEATNQDKAHAKDCVKELLAMILKKEEE